MWIFSFLFDSFETRQKKARNKARGKSPDGKYDTFLHKIGGYTKTWRLTSKGYKIYFWNLRGYKKYKQRKSNINF